MGRGLNYGATLMMEYFVDSIDNLELKKRSDIHWARKIWHMTGVFGMFLAYALLPDLVSSAILAFSIMIFLPVDFLRLRYSAFNDWILHAFRPIMRTNEIDKVAGTTYLLVGVALIVALFPKPIVELTLLFLAFADPLASFIGIKYGKDKIFGHKSVQGFMAAFVVCTFLTLIFLSFHNVVLGRTLVVSLLAGLIGALAELIPIGKLDDNFTLPLMSSVGLYILFSLFGLFAT
jgi:diacylglycerol kinase (CTP)